MQGEPYPFDLIGLFTVQEEVGLRGAKVAGYALAPDAAIILEGTSAAAEKPEAGLARRLSEAYKRKYTADGYSPEPDQWDEGGLYVFTPRQCLAWTGFFENPTKFVFEEA